MDAKTVGPDEVQIECGKLAREANREFRELDSEIKSLETALAQEREKVGKLRKAATFARRGCEYNNMFAECEVLDEALSETAPDAKEADHD
jgi:capsule polysaccharide export protein KpsE/RkpR